MKKYSYLYVDISSKTYAYLFFDNIVVGLFPAFSRWFQFIFGRFFFYPILKFRSTRKKIAFLFLLKCTVMSGTVKNLLNRAHMLNSWLMSIWRTSMRSVYEWLKTEEIIYPCCFKHRPQIIYTYFILYNEIS